MRALFEKMLEDTEEYARTYEQYVADMENYSAKVQWKLGPISGYQVFRGPEYSFETDAEVEDPDILIECDDLGDAKQFFRRSSSEYLTRTGGFGCVERGGS